MLSTLDTEIHSQLNAAVAAGTERGMQVAVYHQGKLIVDAVAGHTDATESTPVKPETVFPVFSVSKGVTTTLVHRLIQQGFFDLDDPICKVWPEFAVAGKEAITVRHALTHTAGLAYLPAELTPEEVGDWSFMCQLMENIAPTNTPGEKEVYHALTFGWLLGGLAEKATGSRFADLLQQEICAPLGLESLFIGLPENAGAEVAVIETCTPDAPLDYSQPQTVPQALWPLNDFINRPATHRACLPGANGLMAARDVARHYAATLPGGVDGVELLTETQRQAALDFPPGLPPGEHVAGYARGDGQTTGPARYYGHNGRGGSQGRAHLDKHLAFSITHNSFSPDTICTQIEKTILEWTDYSLAT